MIERKLMFAIMFVVMVILSAALGWFYKRIGDRGKRIFRTVLWSVCGTIWAVIILFMIISR